MLFRSGFGWVMLPKPAHISSSPAIRLSIMPPPGVELRPGIRGGSAISPDGRSVVFAAIRDGKQELWIRRLESHDARPLPRTEGGILPFWSPDGKSIGFQSRGKIRRIDLAGGAPIDLATATRPARGGWSESGTILFATGSGGPIQQVRATGGQASPAIPEKTGGALWPFPVGGDRFLYFENTSRQVQFASLATGLQGASLFESDSSAVYAQPYNGHPGQLLWLKGATLMAQAFDPASGKLSGDAVAVAEGVGFADRSRMVDLSVSSNGVLVYGPGNTVQSRLASIRRDGSVAQFVGEQEWLRAVRLSPDGRKALIERGIPRAIWIFDFDSNVLTRSTFEKEWSGWPVWSPNGSDIAYSGERDRRLGIYSRSAKGGRPESKLAGAGHDDYLYDWSRDGRHLIYCEVNPQTKLDLWVAPATGDRTPRPFLKTEFNEDWPQFSPDGNWVVYMSDESGRNEVYVTSFPNAEGKWQISTGGGSMPRWAANGEIFFESAAGQIMVLQARPGARQFEWTSPRQLFANPIPGQGYDVTAQGDRLLMMTPVNGQSRNELTVILNWQAALPR